MVGSPSLVYIVKQVSFFFFAISQGFCFFLFEPESNPSLCRKVPYRHLMAALTSGKAGLLFLLELLQLSSVLIIEKIWKIEDLI